MQRDAARSDTYARAAAAFASRCQQRAARRADMRAVRRYVYARRERAP